MIDSKYSLTVISKSEKNKNKTFKSYLLNGQPIIGVGKGEEFEIVFKNTAWEKVQVKICLDGVNILNGKKASYDADGTFVVNGYGELRLQAFPETTKGGSKFCFVSAKKSVAKHLLNDTSSKGIISAIVFTESFVAPKLKEYVPYPVYPTYPYWPWIYPWSTYPYYWWSYNCGSSSDQYKVGGNETFTFGTGNNTLQNVGGTINGATTYGSCINENTYNYRGTSAGSSSIGGSGTYASYNVNLASNGAVVSGDIFNTIASSNAAIGAGEYVEQALGTNTGLILPKFNSEITVRYTWWNELKKALTKANYVVPKDDGQPLINLGSTPRQVKQKKAEKSAPVEYSQF